MLQDVLDDLRRHGHLQGEVVRLALAPVDPRSLMQGDYMALNYEIQNQLRGKAGRQDGYVILALDENRVGRLQRIQENAQPLAAGEVALRYRVRPGWQRGGVRIATNAFFFEEDQGREFETARYGEFRVSPGGEPRLVALLDGRFRELGINRP